MKKSDLKDPDKELLDYRDIPQPEIPHPIPDKNGPLAHPINPGRKWVFDLDKPEKDDFDA